MKNANQTRQNQKFEQRLNHLQGVMGMPHWSTTGPSLEQIRAYDQHGRKLQSSAIQKAVRRGFKVIKSSLLGPIAKMVQMRKERKDLQILLQLDAHTLKDIGLSRADAYGVAKGRVNAEQINAQRQAKVTAQIKARQRLAPVKSVPAPQAARVKTFAANDPRYSSKCA